MSNTRNPTTHLLIAVAIGAVITYGALSLTIDDSAQRQQIASLENRILDLEVLLLQKEEELRNTHFVGLVALEQTGTIAANKPTHTAQAAENMQIDRPDRDFKSLETPPHVDQVLKDLLTLAYGDPRTFQEKVNDFLAENSSKENIAIASKGVFELADNRDVLPDHSLESIYLDQTDPDFKRVVAQVASLRGDNSLIEMQLTQTQKGLKSTSPADRQKALVELGKTRYVGAANMVVPLLQDNDIGVKLDALLALRATGNQSHIRYVENLANHPNESVSWLAKDVINNLQVLSDMARTKLASTDIVAELPPIMMH